MEDSVHIKLKNSPTECKKVSTRTRGDFSGASIKQSWKWNTFFCTERYKDSRERRKSHHFNHDVTQQKQKPFRSLFYYIFEIILLFFCKTATEDRFYSIITSAPHITCARCTVTRKVKGQSSFSRNPSRPSLHTKRSSADTVDQSGADRRRLIPSFTQK